MYKFKFLSLSIFLLLSSCTYLDGNNQQKIHFKGSLYITPAETVNSIKIIDKTTIYIGAKYGLFIIDVTDIEKPKIIDKISLENLDCNKELIVSNDRMYALIDNKLSIFNISNIKNPKLISSLKLNKYMYDLNIFPNQKKISLRDHQEKQYIIINIDNEKKPYIFKTLENDSNLLGRRNIIYSSDMKLAFTTSATSFDIVDISLLDKPKLLSSAQVIMGDASEIEVSNILLSKDKQYLYAINGSNGLKSFNIENINQPLAQGSINDGADSMFSFSFLNNNYIYGTIEGNDLTLINITTKNNPEITSKIDLKSNIEVIITYAENKLIVASIDEKMENSHLHIVDFSEPSKPKILNKVTISDIVLDLKIIKNEIFFLGKKGLKIFQLSKNGRL